MAKYVLLAFDDDKAAEEFVTFVQQQGEVLEGPKYDATAHPATVRGIWKKPTKFCSCGVSKKGFTRGRRYGWWVCANCGRPREAWAKGDIWYTALGLNLLPIDENAPENRGPEHRNHPGYQPKANWCPLHGYQRPAINIGQCPHDLCENVLTISPADREKYNVVVPQEGPSEKP